jgi:replication-associated recombination protein RarA
MTLRTRQFDKYVKNIAEELDKYLKRPSAYSVFVLYGRPLTGKTAVAKEIARRFGGKYSDFLQDRLTQLAGRLRSYEPADFKDEINEMSKSAGPILVVDEIEGLLDTWSRDQQESLFKMLTRWRTHCLVLVVTGIDMSYEEFMERNRVFRVQEG